MITVPADLFQHLLPLVARRGLFFSLEHGCVWIFLLLDAVGFDVSSVFVTVWFWIFAFVLWTF
jgi:hypothetical protein